MSGPDDRAPGPVGPGPDPPSPTGDGAAPVPAASAAGAGPQAPPAPPPDTTAPDQAPPAQAASGEPASVQAPPAQAAPAQAASDQAAPAPAAVADQPGQVQPGQAQPGRTSSGQVTYFGPPASEPAAAYQADGSASAPGGFAGQADNHAAMNQLPPNQGPSWNQASPRADALDAAGGPDPGPRPVRRQLPLPRAAQPKTGGRLSWPMAFLIVCVLAIGSCNFGFFSVSGALGPIGDVGSLDRPGLGVLEIKGEIFDTLWAIEALKRFEDNEQIKAVILRIDSPGGAVAPCQELYGALAAFGKPLVVSMGSVAASGGLYLAVAGNPFILANPGTITGSIGVIMETIQFDGAMEKLGVRAEAITSGPYKDMGSMFRPMLEEERALLQELVTGVWEQFVGHVAAGRPKLTEEQVRSMADGRIFTGEQALALGLVDGLGGWSEAVDKAIELGGIDDADPPMIVEDGDEGWLAALLGSKLGFLGRAERATEPGATMKFLYRPGLF